MTSFVGAGAPWATGRSYQMGRGLLTKKLLDVLLVGRGHHGVAVEAAGPLGRLVLQQVVLAGALAHELAGAGDLEPPLGTTVRLRLRHGRRRLPRPLVPAAAGACPIAVRGRTARSGTKYVRHRGARWRATRHVPFTRKPTPARSPSREPAPALP